MVLLNERRQFRNYLTTNFNSSWTLFLKEFLLPRGIDLQKLIQWPISPHLIFMSLNLILTAVFIESIIFLHHFTSLDNFDRFDAPSFTSYLTVAILAVFMNVELFPFEPESAGLPQPQFWTDQKDDLVKWFKIILGIHLGHYKHCFLVTVINVFAIIVKRRIRLIDPHLSKMILEYTRTHQFRMIMVDAAQLVISMNDNVKTVYARIQGTLFIFTIKIIPKVCQWIKQKSRATSVSTQSKVTFFIRYKLSTLYHGVLVIAIETYKVLQDTVIHIPILHRQVDVNSAYAAMTVMLLVFINEFHLFDISCPFCSASVKAAEAETHMEDCESKANFTEFESISICQCGQNQIEHQCLSTSSHTVVCSQPGGCNIGVIKAPISTGRIRYKFKFSDLSDDIICDESVQLFVIPASHIDVHQKLFRGDAMDIIAASNPLLSSGTILGNDNNPNIDDTRMRIKNGSEITLVLDHTAHTFTWKGAHFLEPWVPAPSHTLQLGPHAPLRVGVLMQQACRCTVEACTC